MYLIEVMDEWEGKLGPGSSVASFFRLEKHPRQKGYAPSDWRPSIMAQIPIGRSFAFSKGMKTQWWAGGKRLPLYLMIYAWVKIGMKLLHIKCSQYLRILIIFDECRLRVVIYLINWLWRHILPVFLLNPCILGPHMTRIAWRPKMSHIRELNQAQLHD